MNMCAFLLFHVISCCDSAILTSGNGFGGLDAVSSVLRHNDFQTRHPFMLMEALV